MPPRPTTAAIPFATIGWQTEYQRQYTWRQRDMDQVMRDVQGAQLLRRPHRPGSLSLSVGTPGARRYGNVDAGVAGYGDDDGRGGGGGAKTRRAWEVEEEDTHARAALEAETDEEEEGDEQDGGDAGRREMDNGEDAYHTRTHTTTIDHDEDDHHPHEPTTTHETRARDPTENDPSRNLAAVFADRAALTAPTRRTVRDGRSTDYDRSVVVTPLVARAGVGAGYGCVCVRVCR